MAGLSGSSTSEVVNVVVPFADSITFTSASATWTTLGAYSGITVPVTNSWTTSQTLVIFATLKSGTSIYILDGTLTLASGGTNSVFVTNPGATTPVPAGTYTVTFSAVTTSNEAVSAPTTPITITVP